jgi:hypothetical protein
MLLAAAVLGVLAQHAGLTTTFVIVAVALAAGPKGTTRRARWLHALQ